MGVLLQAVKWDQLRKLTEVQLQVLNTQLETELLNNEVIRREIGNKANDLMKRMGPGQ